MLFHAQPPKVFWGEALLTTNYLQNRSPTKSISKNKTSGGALAKNVGTTCDKI